MKSYEVVLSHDSLSLRLRVFNNNNIMKKAMDQRRSNGMIIRSRSGKIKVTLSINYHIYKTLLLYNSYDESGKERWMIKAMVQERAIDGTSDRSWSNG